MILSLATTVTFSFLTLWEETLSVFKYVSLELCTKHYIYYLLHLYVEIPHIMIVG